mmetsp:Transcript_9647/g.18234  ORF Transcript_9647/g.18234 Transcript_9647/m.18234 type:complete len:110 (-) Transcript_9647:128-457(-)
MYSFLFEHVFELAKVLKDSLQTLVCFTEKESSSFKSTQGKTQSCYIVCCCLAYYHGPILYLLLITKSSCCLRGQAILELIHSRFKFPECMVDHMCRAVLCSAEAILALM